MTLIWISSLFNRIQWSKKRTKWSQKTKNRSRKPTITMKKTWITSSIGLLQEWRICILAPANSPNSQSLGKESKTLSSVLCLKLQCWSMILWRNLEFSSPSLAMPTPLSILVSNATNVGSILSLEIAISAWSALILTIAQSVRPSMSILMPLSNSGTHNRPSLWMIWQGLSSNSSRILTLWLTFWTIYQMGEPRIWSRTLLNRPMPNSSNNNRIIVRWKLKFRIWFGEWKMFLQKLMLKSSKSLSKAIQDWV